MRKIRLNATLAALALLLAFSGGGCTGETGAEPTSASTPTISANAPTLSGTIVSPAEHAGGIDADTAMLSVGGQAVEWDELYYWLATSVDYYKYNTGEIDWDRSRDGVSVEDYLLADAADSAVLYRTLQLKAAEFGVTLTDEDREYIAQLRSYNVSYFGGEEQFGEYLAESGMTFELYDYFVQSSCLYYDILEYIYGENAAGFSDQEAAAYGEDNGYCRVKRLALSKRGEGGAALTEGELAALRDTALRALDRLDAAIDAEAELDRLIAELGDDEAASYYTDGYQYGGDYFGGDVQEIVNGLDYGEYTTLMETDGEYVILMRLALEPDAPTVSDSYGYSLRRIAAGSVFDSLVSGWTAEAEVAYTEAFDALSLREIFG